MPGPPVITDALDMITDLAARAASPVLDPEFLAGFVRQRIDGEALRRGTPLWVSAFPSAIQGQVLATWGWLVDIVRGWTGAPSEWLHVNELSLAEVHQAILASAALPPVLPSQAVGGKMYRDGGLADVTAAGALVAYGACDVIFVAHLDRAQRWDAHQYPGVPIIEIRPRTGLRDPGLTGGLTAILDFSPERVSSLMEHGYADASDALKRATKILGGVDARRRAQAVLLDAIADPTTTTEDAG